MRRARLILGFVAGAILILSALAHSLLGWKKLGADLAAARAPADLVQYLAMGWHFGGVAMLGFGSIVLVSFLKFRRNQAISLAPVAAIAVIYIAYGTWALVVSRFDPFFLIFVVPGLMLLAASWKRTGDPIWDL